MYVRALIWIKILSFIKRGIRLPFVVVTSKVGAFVHTLAVASFKKALNFLSWFSGSAFIAFKKFIINFHLISGNRTAMEETSVICYSSHTNTKWRQLSNFADAQFYYNSQPHYTAEHAYQYTKAKFFGQDDVWGWDNWREDSSRGKIKIYHRSVLETTKLKIYYNKNGKIIKHFKNQKLRKFLFYFIIFLFFLIFRRRKSARRSRRRTISGKQWSARLW